MPIRAIVTGGAGFIGSHVADALLARGDEVIGGRQPRQRPPRAGARGGATLREVDIRDRDALRALFDEVRPQAVFHLAAQADVRVSVDDPALRRRRQRASARSRCSRPPAPHDARVVFSSTGGALYGEADAIPSPETTPAAAMSPYGISKLLRRAVPRPARNRLYGTHHVILRYGNVYGPRQDPHGEAGVVAIFFGRLLRGRAAADLRRRLPDARLRATWATWSRPTWRRSPTAGRRRRSTSAPETETSVVDLLAACQAAAGHQRRAASSRPARLGELERSCLDCSLAASELGWRPDGRWPTGSRRRWPSLQP